MIKIILFLLPALAYGSIKVNIKASESAAEAAVEIMGANVDIISDKERESFKITDSPLKVAAGKYSGKRPTDVFVKSPTPWGDLYQTYDWQQVTRTLYPRNSRILGIKSSPVIVATREFVNNLSVDATYNAAISQKVSNTVTSSWSVENEISVGQKISYKVDFIIAGAEGETSLSYAHSWGEEHSESQEVSVGSSTGVEITLKPGQSAVATLTATRGTMDVEVDYTASLSGYVAANYEDPYEGHHFWAYDVNGVLEAGGLPQTLDSKEVLKIGFYTNGKVIVSDKHSSETLLVAPVNL